jgi:hypothetical protein
MKLKSLFVACVCGATCAGFAAGSAYAGEATGKPGGGKTTPVANYVMHSICAFSGQNPERFLDPSDPDFEPGRVQSWGVIPKADREFLATIGLHPGDACNGHTGELVSGGGE